MDELLDLSDVVALVEQALAEDRAADDITTDALIPADAIFSGHIRCREPIVVAGLDVADLALQTIGPHVDFEPLVTDGDQVEAATALAAVEGPAREVLPAERVALNFLAHLSGVATLTAAFVRAVTGTEAVIVDTRKTIPGLRILDKYAVRVGGAENHRMDLASMALIKDNHLASCALSPIDAARRVRDKVGRDIPIELEVDDRGAAVEALSAPVDILMLDNFSLDEVRGVVLRRNELSPEGRPLIEVSGGVDLDNVTAYAEAGADRIAVGAVVHSARFVDIGLDSR